MPSGISTGNALPPEVLCEMLWHFEYPIYPRNRGEKYLPLLVCRFWRDVALATPWLWNKISIEDNEDFDSTDHKVWQSI